MSDLEKISDELIRIGERALNSNSSLSGLKKRLKTAQSELHKALPRANIERQELVALEDEVGKVAEDIESVQKRLVDVHKRVKRWASDLTGASKPSVVGPSDNASASGRIPVPLESSAPPVVVLGNANINVADQAELQAVVGLGPHTVREIIERRKAEPFASLDDLVTVRGIGPQRLAKLVADNPHSAPILQIARSPSRIAFLFKDVKSIEMDEVPALLKPFIDPARRWAEMTDGAVKSTFTRAPNIIARLSNLAGEENPYEGRTDSTISSLPALPQSVNIPLTVQHLQILVNAATLVFPGLTSVAEVMNQMIDDLVRRLEFQQIQAPSAGFNKVARSRWYQLTVVAPPEQVTR